MNVRPVLSLRFLRWADAWFCWRLARDPEVRRWSVDPKPPTPLGHWRWMRRYLYDVAPRPSAVVLTVDGRPAGLLTLRPYRDGFAVGISFLPIYRGHGYGAHLLATVRRHVTPFTASPLYALIKSGNVASRAAFARAGFLPSGTADDGLLLYVSRVRSVAVPLAGIPCS